MRVRLQNFNLPSSRTRCISPKQNINIGATLSSAPSLSQKRFGQDNVTCDTRPSLLWKAYAESLKPFLTSEEDLSARHMALYISSPFTFGIAGGDHVPVEIRNQQIFKHCDCALDLQSPILDSIGSCPSYFDAQFKILSQGTTVSDERPSSKLASAQQKLQLCQQATLEAYKAEASRYFEIHKVDTSVTFTDWMSRFGVEYSAAWSKLQAQFRVYQRLLDASASPLGDVMDMMLSANSKLVYRAGNNMPCSAQDLQSPHFRTDDHRATLEHDTKDVFYRPLYALSDYDRLVDNWIETYDSNARPSCILNLDLNSDTPWSHLGFPHFDRETFPPNNDFGSAHISFGQPRSALLKDHGVPDNASVSLYGLQAFDVERGFWNIEVNPHLGTRSEDAAAEPLMKITRVLCSYKMSIKARFSCYDRRRTLLGAAPSPTPDEDGSLHYETRNDAVIVPQLLAVLAKQF